MQVAKDGLAEHRRSAIRSDSYSSVKEDVDGEHDTQDGGGTATDESRPTAVFLRIPATCQREIQDSARTGPLRYPSSASLPAAASERDPAFVGLCQLPCRDPG